MQERLAERCQLFIQNRDVLRAALKKESPYIYPICAAIVTECDQIADPMRIKYCKDLLKEQTGVFSEFRGIVRAVVITMLSVDSNPQIRMEHAQQVYDHLKDSFGSSNYLCVAAMVISELVDVGYYKPMAEHTRRIYELLKSKHPFLTGAEDSVFSALLSVSKKTDERIVEETEQCYRILQEYFHNVNAVQSLAHVLALCEGDVEEKCRNTFHLYEALRGKGIFYGTDFELPTLGILAMLPVDRSQTVELLLQVDHWLSSRKGYGLFGLGKRHRLMHAAMIVSDYIMDQYAITQTGIRHSTLALAAAHQAALCAAIAASDDSSVTQ